MQALINTGLIGAERAAALQHQRNDIVWQRMDLLRRIELLARHVQHGQNSQHCG